jgi:hypothetical protein
MLSDSGGVVGQQVTLIGSIVTVRQGKAGKVRRPYIGGAAT